MKKPELVHALTQLLQDQREHTADLDFTNKSFENNQHGYHSRLVQTLQQNKTKTKTKDEVKTETKSKKAKGKTEDKTKSKSIKKEVKPKESKKSQGKPDSENETTLRRSKRIKREI